MARRAAGALALFTLIFAVVCAFYPGEGGRVSVAAFCRDNGYSAAVNVDLAYISITRGDREVRVYINLPYVTCGRSIRYMSGGISVSRSGEYELPAEYALVVREFMSGGGMVTVVSTNTNIVTNRFTNVMARTNIVVLTLSSAGASSDRGGSSSAALSGGSSSSRKDDPVRVSNYTRTGDSFKPISAIVLDAGHGGKDPGGLGVNGIKEKEIVLAITTMLRDGLKARGFTNIVLTRKTDVFLSLDERTEITTGLAKKYNALFISVHGNISLNRKIDGVEVYSLADAASDADAQLVEANENAPFLKDLEKTEAIYSIISDLFKDELRRESEILAIDVARSMIKTMGATLRGVKKANFYVLKYNQVPSILVEVGFLSHGGESKKLLNKTYQKKTAEGIANGIVQFIEKYNKSRGFTR